MLRPPPRARTPPLDRAATARDLRRRATPAERALWLLLRDYRLDGQYFWRQYRIGPFVVDFVCRRFKLIVEVDGGYHDNDAQISADLERETYLMARDYQILRFTNAEVLHHIADVLSTIQTHLPPTPSRFARGAGGE